MTIENILALRDKIYAHTDSNKKDYSDIKIDFDEIEILLEIVEKIIKEIFADVFDSEVDMGNFIFDRNNFNIIKILAQENKCGIE